MFSDKVPIVDKPRRPCVFIIESSAAVSGEPLHEFEHAIKPIIEEIKLAEPTNTILEIAVITCGSSAEVVCKFEASENFKLPKLSANGLFQLSPALLLANDLIQTRKHCYKEDCLPYYVPYIFLLAKSKVDDDLIPIRNFLEDGFQKKQFQFQAFALDENSMVNFEWLPSQLSKPKLLSQFAKDLKHPARKETENINSNWVIVGGSVIGKGHVSNDIPCQDAHLYKLLDKDWGIAILSDGAGSCENSHLGSGFVVERGMGLFEDLIETKRLAHKNKLPKEAKWREWSLDIFKQLRNDVQLHANEIEVELKSLSCTIIVVVFSPKGLLTAHIGDGRAGYLEENGSWLHSITPFKGEQVGTTVFLTTEFIWEALELYIETRVIECKLKAFTLLSDGCEFGCFECYQKRENNQGYHDPNKPYDKFFNPNIEALLTMNSNSLSQNEMNKKWEGFLHKGNEVFEKETDDKTMILAVLKNV